MEGDGSSSRDAERRQRIDEQQEQLETLGKRISDLDGANEAEARRARDAEAGSEDAAAGAGPAATADEPDAGADDPEDQGDAGGAGA
jgi:hypothetical protein